MVAPTTSHTIIVQSIDELNSFLPFLDQLLKKMRRGERGGGGEVKGGRRGMEGGRGNEGRLGGAKDDLNSLLRRIRM